jgi:hypothetical protein
MSGAGLSVGLDAELAGIPTLSRPELLERWSQDWGKEPPKYVSRRLLELSAAWHLQCRMYGGPDRELRRLLRGSDGADAATAERIRDKIAASKKKGMWMGGPPPLGYDVENRQLVINETGSKNRQDHLQALPATVMASAT